MHPLLLSQRHAHVARATDGLHPVFAASASAAINALTQCQSALTRAELERDTGLGADGTPTMHLDRLVEEAIVDATAPYGVNILSEEIGFVDRGSALTLVVDPVDGSANAAADVPLSCFSAALADDHRFVAAATTWLETGRTWAADAAGTLLSPGRWETTGRSTLAGAAVSLLRPHQRNRDAWWRVTERAARIRILSTTCLEAMLVLQGSTDAFVDAGSDTHRLVDLAAATVLLPLAGGVVMDLHGRPIEFDLDLTKRWSGIVAASRELAEEIVEVVLNG